ncbi:PAS-domain containing protein [Pseudoruegeria sp. SK021]|uniref:PAS-domain containing protein n=1 Tax=Pseudoruegeria sp. SK021 TaxID=1933035 RepID=UPI000A21EB71|nr:PAS-domain containing protein [Pseudoruegeria sp. SK021]OSP54615.1 hypothetical protein BV911_11465 [Pseudoruegeria sp. SK021]
MFDFHTHIASGLIASVSATLAVFGLYHRWRRKHLSTLDTGDTKPEDEIVFLFDNRTLVDATLNARAQIPAEPASADDWTRFVAAYSQRFEGLEAKFHNLDSGEHAEIYEDADDPDSLRLQARRVDGLLRIVLIDPVEHRRSDLIAHFSLAAMRAELTTLRAIAEKSPVLTWKQRQDGTIVWANSAYLDLIRSVAGEAALFAWPPPDIFAEAHFAQATSDLTRRVPIPAASKSDKLWFDVVVLHGDAENLCFASPADRVVRAESALNEFVQTLTKTFAHLTIGLAIFDRNRQLALFNPALIDLTGLPAEQLSGRPSLHSFLDALRDRQRIPEPKDYKSWRLHIAQLEAGAENGTYEEVWHLSSGETYRVTGRPHPDGAVAYVFEDISLEVSMTRSFRSEIEISQSVLDNIDTAVAAFSRDGALSLCNQSYTSLWTSDPETSLASASFGQALDLWQSRCRADEAWDDIANSVLNSTGRSPWAGKVVMQDGTVLLCRVRALTAGGTLVSFDRLDQNRDQALPSQRAIA